MGPAEDVDEFVSEYGGFEVCAFGGGDGDCWMNDVRWWLIFSRRTDFERGIDIF